MQSPVVFDFKLGKFLYNELDQSYNKLTADIKYILLNSPEYLTTEETKNKKMTKKRKMLWRMNNTLNKTHYFAVNGFK
ncbi:MAG: hypothetical protein MHPSP_004331, partial [Paramarteilia canceri]